MPKNWSISLSVKTIKVWFFLDPKSRLRSKLLDLSNLNFATKNLKRCKIWTDDATAIKKENLPVLKN